MVKTLEEINREFEMGFLSENQDNEVSPSVTLHNRNINNIIEVSSEQPQKKRGFRAVGILTSFVFYVVIISAILAAVLYKSNSGEGPAALFGYSYFKVLTTSMQSVYPKGSLVISKHVDTDSLNIDDDITFIDKDGKTITHRILDIYENYDEKGGRGFQTKGVENHMADDDIVYEANVLGIVVFHMANVGEMLSFLKERVWLVILIFVILIVLAYSLKMFFRTRHEEDYEEEEGAEIAESGAIGN